MEYNKNKSQDVIRALLKAIVNQEKALEKFSNMLNSSKNIFNISIESNDVMPYEEIATALKLEKEYEYEKIYQELGDMIDLDENIDILINNFITKYNL